MLSSRNSVYKPSLDQISEESTLDNEKNIDQLLLEEYAVISDTDLNISSENSQVDSSEDKSLSDFLKMHNKIKARSSTTLSIEVSSLPATENSLNDIPLEVPNSEIDLNLSANVMADNFLVNPSHLNEEVLVSINNLNMPIASFSYGIDIDSNEGRKFFMKAIKGKYMNVYYPYTKEFLSDRSSDFYFNNLSMMFKILDCDLALTGFDLNSHKLSDLLFTLILQLVVDVTQVHIFSSIESFRTEIKSCCRYKNSAICCYLTVNPCNLLIVLGYLKECDNVLLLHDKKLIWVDLKQLWETLQENNNETGGYIILRKPSSQLSQNTMKLTVSKGISLIMDKSRLLEKHMSIISVIDSWSLWLTYPVEKLDDLQTELETKVINQGLLFFVQLVKDYTNSHLECMNYPQKILKPSDKFLLLVMKTGIFTLIKSYTASLDQQDQKLLCIFCSHLQNLFQHSEDEPQKMKESHNSYRKKKSPLLDGLLTFDAILTCIILFWPDYAVNKSTNAGILSQATQRELENFKKSTVAALQYQISIFIRYITVFSVSENNS